MEQYKEDIMFFVADLHVILNNLDEDNEKQKSIFNKLLKKRCDTVNSSVIDLSLIETIEKYCLKIIRKIDKNNKEIFIAEVNLKMLNGLL